MLFRSKHALDKHWKMSKSGAYKKIEWEPVNKESDELDESKELAKKYIAKVVDPIHGTPRSSVKLQQRLKGIKLAQRLLQKEGFGQAGLEQRLKSKHGIDLNKQAKEWETSAKEKAEKNKKAEDEQAQRSADWIAKFGKPSVKEENQHYCAKHVRSGLLGDGVVLEGQHADPDNNGQVSWYMVEFKDGIHKVFTEDLEIMVAEWHNNHKKKKKGG